MDRRALAFHEAGHAVVALDLGVRVVEISIEPCDDSQGHVLYEKTYPAAAYEILMAGGAAQAWVDGAEPLCYGDDWERGLAAIDQFIEARSRPCKASEILLCKKMLDKSLSERMERLRPAIEQVAELLLEHGTMSVA